MRVTVEECWREGMFAVTGNATIDRLLEVFRYGAKRYGIRQFVIDSLMMTDVPEDGRSVFWVFCNVVRRKNPTPMCFGLGAEALLQQDELLLKDVRLCGLELGEIGKLPFQGGKVLQVGERHQVPLRLSLHEGEQKALVVGRQGTGQITLHVRPRLLQGPERDFIAGHSSEVVFVDGFKGASALNRTSCTGRLCPAR